jgi:hypothetical protein
LRFAAASQPWTLAGGRINNHMQQYLLAKARSTTGQTVKNQDLTGARFTHAQRAIAQETADQLAVKMTARTGDTWTGFVESYTPSIRRNT